MTAGWPPLSSVIVIPLVSALVCSGPWFAKERDSQSRLCRVWALLAALGTLVVLLAIASAGVSSPSQTLRVEEVYPWIPSWGISLHLTLDGISFAFSLLTAIVTLSVIAWSSKPTTAGAGWYAALLMGEAFVLGAFLATDLVAFYVCYELMLIPVLAGIALWGGALRMQAALKFLLYTMVGSVLMFIAIVYVGWRAYEILEAHSGVPGFAFNITTLATLPRLPVSEQIVLGLCFLIAFGVKIPAVPLHGWLQDTYREAPYGLVAFTAALLGKVGLYGVIRFVWPLFPDCMELLAPGIAALGAIGVLYGALIALSQSNIRSLLAFSSLSHLGFCVLGVATASDVALTGAIFQSISHGFVTAALFLVFGAIMDREGASEFDKLGGLASKLPVAAFFLMIFSLAAVALPLTSSFVGEFLIIVSSWETYPQWTVVALSGVVLGAVYTLTAYLKTMFGATSDALPMRRSDLRGAEVLVAAGLALIVVWLGVFPSKLLSLVEGPVSWQLRQMSQSERTEPKRRVFTRDSAEDSATAPSDQPARATMTSFGLPCTGGCVKSPGDLL